MGIVLGPSQYGKAENRRVRIHRDSLRHEIRGLNVSTALRGDFTAVRLDGDQGAVLPADTQKQVSYACALEVGVGEIEDLALASVRHFVRDVAPVTGRRVEVHEYAWELADFLIDEYTILAPTSDPMMATSLVTRWRYVGTDVDRGTAYGSIRQILLEQFATVHSRALQQTLYSMGRAVLEAHEEVAEITFSADDRPYGLIQAAVLRDDAPPAGWAWDTVPRFV